MTDLQQYNQIVCGTCFNEFLQEHNEPDCHECQRTLAMDAQRDNEFEREVRAEAARRVE